MPYNRNIYIIDLEKLAHWIVPVRWRLPRMMVWVKAMAITWIDLFNRFVSYRAWVKYNLLVTPQVCYLKKALNDRYDFIQRRIIIDDGDEQSPVYLFRRAENKQVYIFKRSEGKPVYLISRRETAQFGVDFLVKVPSDISFDMAEMVTYLSGYKLATKTFSIVTI